ncbi:MAG: alpha-ketoglutarate-dependent dioxygenase AlkB, partial [Pseudohongiellaceae bacterium]
MSAERAEALLTTLIDSVPWRQELIRLYGRELPVPRLQCWMGDPHSAYSYSGLSLKPLPWSAPVQKLRTEVEALAGAGFNSVLLNYYRDGRDSVAWHADDEAELGPAPVIASLSLGAARPFHLRHKRTGQRHRLSLPGGSLLVMGGTLQQHWLHQLPKVKGLEAARINLTFR